MAEPKTRREKVRQQRAEAARRWNRGLIELGATPSMIDALKRDERELDDDEADEMAALDDWEQLMPTCEDLLDRSPGDQLLQGLARCRICTEILIRAHRERLVAFEEVETTSSFVPGRVPELVVEEMISIENRVIARGTLSEEALARARGSFTDFEDVISGTLLSLRDWEYYVDDEPPESVRRAVAATELWRNTQARLERARGRKPDSPAVGRGALPPVLSPPEIQNSLEKLDAKAEACDQLRKHHATRVQEAQQELQELQELLEDLEEPETRGEAAALIHRIRTRLRLFETEEKLEAHRQLRKQYTAQAIRLREGAAGVVLDGNDDEATLRRTALHDAKHGTSQGCPTCAHLRGMLHALQVVRRNFTAWSIRGTKRSVNAAKEAQEARAQEQKESCAKMAEAVIAGAKFACGSRPRHREIYDAAETCLDREGIKWRENEKCSGSYKWPKGSEHEELPGVPVTKLRAEVHRQLK